MRYLGEGDVTQMMGIGYVGEVRQGPDGNHYQFVQGVDGLGNPVGSWWKRLARRALPLVRQFAPFVPGGAAALTALSPFLKQAGVAETGGLGQLYQTPDGALYRMQGVAQDNALRGFGDGDGTPLTGVGYLGEVRQSPDGMLYQWVEGVDGLGNPVGFWKKLSRLARRAVNHPLFAALQTALPIPQPVAAMVPVSAPALTPVPSVSQPAPANDVAGFGALYQAADGSLFQGISENELQGLDDDAELLGLAADEDLQGIDDDPELRGFAADEELRGMDEDMELHGMDEDAELRGIAADAELTGVDDGEDLRGFGADQEMQGVDGYVRQDGVNGFEAYVQQEPPQTRAHVRPAQSPEFWKPLW
ncbi:MAG: hypothetical protein ABI831_12410 [Betaproteobacteria bacterium]